MVQCWGPWVSQICWICSQQVLDVRSPNRSNDWFQGSSPSFLPLVGLGFEMAAQFPLGGSKINAKWEQKSIWIVVELYSASIFFCKICLSRFFFFFRKSSGSLRISVAVGKLLSSLRGCLGKLSSSKPPEPAPEVVELLQDMKITPRLVMLGLLNFS